MAGKSIGLLFAALLAFAPVASAATWTVGDASPRTFATESVTSGDVVIDFQGVRPEVRAGVTLTDDEVELIDRNDTVDLTFTLVNAKFARAVRISALTVVFAGVQQCDTRVIGVDSEAGSASATFTVETVPRDSGDSGDCAVSPQPVPRRATFTLVLPALTGLDNTKQVLAKLAVDAPGGSGWPTLSAGEEITTSNVDAQGTEQGYLVAYLDALRVEALGAALQNGRFVNATSSEIDLAAGRTSFTAPGQAHLAIVRVGRAGANQCTSRVPPYGGLACILQRDGRPFSLGRGGDGRGDLNVTVTGDFRDGDVVFLDLDDDRMPGRGESLDLQADSSMRKSFPLDYVAGNPNAAQGEAGDLDREEGVATRNLYYLPNGTDPLRQGEYRTTVTLTTDSAAVADKVDFELAVNTHTTRYTLVEETRTAYAIPAPGAAESVRVRVKCESATPCRLYLECDAADGTSYFAQVEEPLPGRATLALTAEALGNTLGIEAGAWDEGRMSCFVYSTRQISVQQLTRSGGVLANNTYVDD